MKIYPFVRPHRSTTYVDSAYCYRPNGVVCQSVCLSVTVVSSAKTIALTEMPCRWVEDSVRLEEPRIR